MPAIRSSSRQSSLQPGQQPLQSRSNKPPVSDVIILSSDDESSYTKKKRGSAATKPFFRRKGKTAIPVTAEVVEISSDEETLSRTTSRRTSSSAQSAINKLKQQLKDAHDEIERLKARTVDGHLSLSSLEDHTTCEICTMRLWSPYALPCGHTFCKSCLIDWFGTAQAQHLASHPNYNPNPPILQSYRTALSNPSIDPRTRRELQSHIILVERSQEHPQYTCPTCRAVIKTRPVEVFTLKSIVHQVASVLGETSPTTLASTKRADSNDGPWDGFFPQKS